MVNQITPWLPGKRNLGIVALIVIGLLSFAAALDGGTSGRDGTSGGGGTDGGGGGGGGTEPAAALSFDMSSATVPPNGVYQAQLDLTEPLPLGKGSSAFTISSTSLGSGVGAAINSPSGQACGVVLPTASGLQVSFTSPDGSLGTNTTVYPIITLAMPVRSNATIGSQIPVSLNLANSVFLSPTGQTLTAEIKPGTLTVGGTLSITNVLPGGGTVAAGSKIAILGLGFTSSTTVQVSGANVVTTHFVSSNELDVTLDRSLVLDGAGIQVTNAAGTVLYYSYFRATDSGSSSQPLLAAADPMFSLLTYSNASLPWTNGSSVFTGLAMQNTSSSAASVTLELHSSTNQILQSVNVPLAAASKMTRNLSEFFGPPPQGATTVVIRSNLPIQLLGIQGDTTAGTLTPVVVTAL